VVLSRLKPRPTKILVATRGRLDGRLPLNGDLRQNISSGECEPGAGDSFFLGEENSMANPIAGMNANLPKLGQIDSRAPNAGGGFTATLKETLDQINQLQAQADQKVAGLATGNAENIPSTMIAVERANVAFQLMVEVRNKIVQAYQEVSQMSF
jgi:flagellar hook-basal body complex protein FliE